ncbi:hypothetical protein [Sphingobacterium hungaricum]|uniref:Uncharacterized protein n=1 Tax=Sphingobacterium hungaricum TaxID=2082723 RepID=A0A928UX27_9SPHI|nr:hypothetical protein [Sphingobacterium hungaricum]MBE8712689.1 hypothetical protein [Sphingobacterium hungaricum]
MKIKMIAIMVWMLNAINVLGETIPLSASDDKGIPMLNLLSYGINLVCLIVIFILLLNIKRIKKAENLNKITNDFKNQSTQERHRSEELYKKQMEYRRRYEECEFENDLKNIKIGELESEIEEIKKAYSANINQTEDVEESIVKVSSTLSQVETMAKCEEHAGIFYLKPADHKDRKTLYKVIEKDGESMFTIDSTNSDAITNALSFYDVYIDGYCESVNSYEDTCRTIEVVNDSYGKLLKESERFKVTEKLKIRFK